MNFIEKIMAGGFLAGQKTYVTAIVGIISTISLYLVGDMNLNGLVPALIAAFTAIFLKAGQNRIASTQTLQVAADAGQLNPETVAKVVLNNNVSVNEAATAAITKANK